MGAWVGLPNLVYVCCEKSTRTQNAGFLCGRFSLSGLGPDREAVLCHSVSNC